MVLNDQTVLPSEPVGKEGIAGLLTDEDFTLADGCAMSFISERGV